MMHARVLVPSSHTDALLRHLRADPAVTGIVVLTGAAVEPVGDVVEFDVARENTGDVLAYLRDLGVERSGSVSVDTIDLLLSDAAAAAERAAPGLAEDTVVWEEVEEHTGNETRLSITYLVFMAVATMIAAVGLLLDQPILIVGAMVVGPDFGPLAALSVAIVRRRVRVVGRSLLALGAGFGFGMAVTALFTWAVTGLGLLDVSMLTRGRPNLDFIWRPDELSWVIGFLAGIAGLISFTSERSGVLVGVAISVTTIPAAANAAVAGAYGVVPEALGSLGQLGANLLSIVLGGAATLAVQRIWRHRRRPASP